MKGIKKLRYYKIEKTYTSKGICIVENVMWLETYIKLKKRYRGDDGRYYNTYEGKEPTLTPYTIHNIPENFNSFKKCICN